MMTLLSTNNLSIQINERNICSQFNFALQPGEIWGVLGPNGVGKTTLLHTLAGLRPSQQGTVQLKQHAINSITPKQRAQHIGLLTQQVDTAFPQTVFEFVAASRFPHQAYFAQLSEQDRQKIHHALNTMALHDAAERAIQTLSGGEQRRLAIAAVLAQTPAVYLLDEPVNHLDMQHQLRALRHFQQLAQTQQVGIMMSLHDVNLAQAYCTHIIMLHPNGYMQQGSVCDILTEQYLSALYKVNITAVPYNGQTIWHHR